MSEVKYCLLSCHNSLYLSKVDTTAGLICEMCFVKLSFVPFCQAEVKKCRRKAKDEFGLATIWAGYGEEAFWKHFKTKNKKTTSVTQNTVKAYKIQLKLPEGETVCIQNKASQYS